jgi:hypothetical protein
MIYACRAFVLATSNHFWITSYSLLTILLIWNNLTPLLMSAFCLNAPKQFCRLFAFYRLLVLETREYLWMAASVLRKTLSMKKNRENCFICLLIPILFVATLIALRTRLLTFF